MDTREKSRRSTTEFQQYLLHLITHLNAVEAYDDIDAVLRHSTGQNSNAWYATCLEQDRIRQFVEDLETALYGNRRSLNILRQLRYVVMSCSLNSVTNNMPSEFLATLLETGLWSLERCLTYIAQLQFGRPKAIAFAQCLSVRFDDLPDREALFSDFRRAISTIRGDRAQAEALVAASKFLPTPVRQVIAESLLTSIKSSGTLAQRIDLLVAAAEMLSESHFEALLDLVGDAATRPLLTFRGLLALLPYAPRSQHEELRDKAFDASLRIDEPIEQASAFAQIGQYLSPEQQQNMLDAIVRFDDKSYVLIARSGFLGVQPRENRQQQANALLDVLPLIRSEAFRSQAFERILPSLQSTTWERVNPIIKTLHTEAFRAKAICAAVPYLSDVDMQAVFGEYETFQDMSNQALVIAAVLDRYPSAEQIRITEEFLSRSASAKTPFKSGESAAILLQNLPADLRRTVIEHRFRFLEQIGDTEESLVLLAALFPHVTKKEQPRTLQMINREIRRVHPEAQAALYAAIVRFLPETARNNLFNDFAANVETISNPASRVKLWIRVLQYVPKAKVALTALTDTMCRATNENEMFEQMKGLVPYLPVQLREMCAERIRTSPARQKRAQRLLWLAKWLPPASQRAALSDAFAQINFIQKANDVRLALLEIKCDLPAEIAGRYLEAVDTIAFLPQRLEIFIQLVDYIPASIRPMVHREIRNLLQDVWSHHARPSESTARIAGYQAKQGHPDQALKTIHNLDDSIAQAKAITYVAPSFADDNINQLFDAVKSIRFPNVRASALADLLHRSSNPDDSRRLPSAFLAAQTEENDAKRAHILVQLVERTRRDGHAYAEEAWWNSIDRIRARKRTSAISDLVELLPLFPLISQQDFMLSDWMGIRQIMQWWP